MLKVLQIVSGMNRGGLETFVMNVYRNIDREKIQFDFLLHSEKDCDYNAEIRSLGGKIYVVPARNKGIMKNKKALDLFFKEHQEYSVVHMHESSLSYIEPLCAARRNGVPVRILHSHNTSLAKGNTIHRILHKIHQKNIDTIATHYFACSDEAGKWMFGNKNLPVQFVKNGIETQKFIYNRDTRSKYRQELDIENKFVIGHVGRFTYAKNHLGLVDIFWELSKKDNNAVLLLVGDGPQRELVHKKLEEYHLENKVIFLGVRTDIPQLLQAMDILVFPSVYEGLPVTLVEAQTAGLKCIVSDIITRQVLLSDLIEFVDLKKGPNYWAEKICKSDNYHRNNMYETIRASGFDIQNETQLLQQFYFKASNCESV